MPAGSGVRSGSDMRRDTVVRGERSDAGMATAELAVSLPALALLLAVGLGALGVIREQIECVDAAREIALAHARGEDPPAVAADAVEVSNDGDVVRVVVRQRMAPLGGRLPGIDISATAVAVVEPGEEEAW